MKFIFDFWNEIIDRIRPNGTEHLVLIEDITSMRELLYVVQSSDKVTRRVPRKVQQESSHVLETTAWTPLSVPGR